MSHYCNPLDLDYRYQYVQPNPQISTDAPDRIYREAADPSMVSFQGRYWVFPSMTAGFFVSDDLVNWQFHEFVGGPDAIPVVDYAPDVCVVGDWLYFCASKMGENCPFYRSKDPIHQPFERIDGSFDFWDPDLFRDDDGRLYLYWGCSNTTPIWGVELDPDTMLKKGEPVALISGDVTHRGFDRIGDDHQAPKSNAQIEAEIDAMVQRMMAMPLEQRQTMGMDDEDKLRAAARSFLGNDPYIEGAWMTKHQGKYYLQYATPGTQYNVYGDGVFVADTPLGPFTLASNNPYSYKPGGFMNGGGHGSTMCDEDGRWWHIATMVISVNYDMERRLALWKAGFDDDGELFCDQRYGDWPIDPQAPAWSEPDWMLLSYGAATTVSSGTDRAAYLTDEHARTWWRADTADSGQWAMVDLGAPYDVRAVQLNFADEGIVAKRPADAPSINAKTGNRAIDMKRHATRWLLEYSLDAQTWDVLDDRLDPDRTVQDRPHPCLVHEQGVELRYLRLTIAEMPFRQPACVSGIRVFGVARGSAPSSPSRVEAVRNNGLDMTVSWLHDPQAVGHNVLWGYRPDKLYHSSMVFGSDTCHVGALVAGQDVFVRVDAFNRSGITHGTTMQVTQHA